ncbi:MAG: biopolymer transporter ExbD [Pseudomonadota bacterium]
MNVRPRTQPEVNLTSLIDVVLLLLIFFMVSTSFVKESQININLPETDGAEAVSEAADALEITITENGTYYVNGRELINSRPETIRNALRSVSDGNTDRPVTISADAGADYQFVVTAMDVVSRMGFKDFNLATVNEPAE